MSDIFSKTPNEIVFKILSFLPAKDLCSVSLVNKNLWSFIQDDYVWQSICVNQFPAACVSEERKKMIAEEAALREHDTSVSGFSASLIWNVPSKGSNSDEQQINVVNKMNGKKLYRRLSRQINFIAKERGVCWLDCQDGGGNRHHWRTLEDSQSEFGKIVFLEYVWWFDVLSILKAVLPGTYDVIWRLKVGHLSGYRHMDLHGLNFCTVVIEKIEDEVEDEGTIHDKQTYNYIPQRSMYSNIFNKNDWVEYRLPYKLVVPERKVIDGKLIYHDVHLKIFNYDRSLKSRLGIDYVRLREHNESIVYEQFE